MAAIGYRSLDALQAAWSLEELEAEHVPDLAVRLLQQGHDSHSVRVLAGLDSPTYWDVIDPLEQLMRELKRERLPAPQAARLVAYDVIVRVEQGEVSLREGLYRLNGLYMSQWEKEELDALVMIPGVLDDLEDGWSGKPRDQIEAEARDLLRQIRGKWDGDPRLRTVD